MTAGTMVLRPSTNDVEEEINLPVSVIIHLIGYSESLTTK